MDIQSALHNAGLVTDHQLAMSRIQKVTVGAAYGRKYSNEDAVRQSWRDEKDFLIVSIQPPTQSGRYMNVRDHKRLAPQATVIFVSEDLRVRLEGTDEEARNGKI